ncbi:citramalate synthase [Streptomyces caniscabiei]|uniref:Citramalate synthase n=1 Tax=Streptomyces caniscabiei TaxID=2746961 RepID=A0A927LB58_9ACTN|nr:citramalate synthase [Streptomyces caniscabiei]MBD9729466.1 citramalate synthase [Streptomyces caniscabiei]MDX3515059.1 citramalate synthase [Streptomyces caniscabiei]MDX3718181.1 citramalate synthase [Streptomyces caniscabiei]WEO22398.1 citramalate synthase [Streptomyces caniscabiei]
MVHETFHVFDTTLRDGAQREGINLTVADKLTIARYLDDFGVGFIEGGWPGANPRDTEFFARARDELDLQHAQLVAFGATRRAGISAAEDLQLAALIDSGAPVVTLVAKSHDRHVELALRTTLDENLEMLRDSVRYLREQGRRVFVDCEHFFDGFRGNRDYALAVVSAAHEAGADVVVLCDTNGGTLPWQVQHTVTHVLEQTGARLGIHAQDDTGCAVANTLAAVEAGATHVQCTANGYGERVGNANLFPVVATLELKLNRRVLPPGRLAATTRISHAIAEVVNLTPSTHQPYVGASAFAHKAGLHASAIKLDPDLYQHIDPELVGNSMRTLVSDMAGRASIELKAKELGYDLCADRDKVGRIVARIKERENAGYTYEAADASFELLLREEIFGHRDSFFELESWRVISEEASGKQGQESEAAVKLRAQGRRSTAVAEGNGPVNAMDRALRQALHHTHPEVDQFELVNYKVRILEGHRGTEARIRVLISVTDGQSVWHTVGVADNIIAASCEALQESLTYGMLQSSGTGTGGANESTSDCTLTVTLHNNPGALRRITTTLGNIPVTELSYAAPFSAQATARIQVPRANVMRARNKLNRLVEVLAVTEGTVRS